MFYKLYFHLNLNELFVFDKFKYTIKTFGIMPTDKDNNTYVFTSNV